MAKLSINEFVKQEKDKINFRVAKLEFLKNQYSDIVVKYSKNIEEYHSKLVNKDCNKVILKFNFLSFIKEIDFSFNGFNEKLIIKSQPLSLSFSKYVYGKHDNGKYNYNYNNRSIIINNINKKLNQLKFPQNLINESNKYIISYINKNNNYKIIINDPKLKKILIMA